MKISKYFRTSLVLVSFIVLFTSGCTEKDTTSTDDGSSFEGYILDVEEGRVLVAYDITAEKFNQISDKTIEDLSKSAEYIPLIYLSYDDTSSLNKGSKVKVWIEGGIDDSYPQQAGAKLHY
jgi:ribosomal protein S1